MIHTASVHEQLDAALNGVAFLDLMNTEILQAAGKDVLDLIHRLSTNDVLSLPAGGTRSTAFCTEKGRVLSIVDIVHFADLTYLAAPAGNGVTVRKWIDKFTILEDIRWNEIMDMYTVSCLIGPKAISTITMWLGISVQRDVATRTSYLEQELVIWASVRGGIEHVQILSGGAGPTLIGGGLASSAFRENIVQISPDAYGLLCILQGIPTFPGEISGVFTPYEIGSTNLISFSKGCYIGQEVIARMETYQKTGRKLYVLQLPPTPPPDAAAKVMKGGTEVGLVTTASKRTIGSAGYALAVLKEKEVQGGDHLEVFGGDASLEVTAFEPPYQLV